MTDSYRTKLTSGIPAARVTPTQHPAKQTQLLLDTSIADPNPPPPTLNPVSRGNA